MKNNNEQEKKNVNDKKDLNKNKAEEKQKPVDLNARVNALLVDNENFKKIIQEKDNKILNLEKQIETYNNNYKNEINKKAIEAQKLVEDKIKELQEKFDKDIAHIKKFALKDKAIDLINIISNFDLALSHTPDNEVVANYVQGFKMFSNMFQNYLSSNNIVAIIPKVGEEFNSKNMEAIEIKEDSNFKTNQIIKVVKNGYMLHDVVIIPSVVIVAK